MTIETPDGRDPTKAIEEALRREGKKVTRDAMDVWFTAAQDRLIEAAEQRAGSGGADDSEGMVSRQQNALTDMIDEFQPVQWDDSEEQWTFAITHEAAIFHEFGADAHEIEAGAARALAFEWPDAPQEVKEKFENSFPTVFYDSVSHPGTPAIGFVRHGRQVARDRLQQAGYTVEEFGAQGAAA